MLPAIPHPCLSHLIIPRVFLLISTQISTFVTSGPFVSQPPLFQGSRLAPFTPAVVLFRLFIRDHSLVPLPALFSAPTPVLAAQ